MSIYEIFDAFLVALLFLVVVLLAQVVFLIRRHNMWRIKFETFTIVEHYQRDQELRAAIHQLSRTDEVPPYDRESGSEIFSSAVRVANFCEFLAVGIRQGVFDEQVVKDAFGGTFIAFHSKLERFILEARQRANRPEVYSGFGELVEKWRRHPWREHHE